MVMTWNCVHLPVLHLGDVQLRVQRGIVCDRIYPRSNYYPILTGILAEALLTALPYLQLAENDYRAIQIPAAIQDVLYITSVLYNTLANIAAKSNAPNLVLQVEYTRERDAAAERHAQAVEDEKKLEMVTVTEGWDEMWRTVSMVATKTASRRLFYEKE